MITSSLFDRASIRHGFFTREGGVSTGVYAGLNCGAGSEDLTENVRSNKRRAMQKLGMNEDDLATVYQIHSTEVVYIKDRSQIAEKPKADALVTCLPGIALGILTADCVPILFADAKNGVIGAAHSGWKGALGNIAKEVIDVMVHAGAERSQISAAIGPSIQHNSYEVGPDFPAPFIKLDEANKAFFSASTRDGHFMFDLTGFVKMQLEHLQIGAVDRLSHDTCTDERLFFSYRRMCKRKEADYGRQLSSIALVK